MRTLQVMAHLDAESLLKKMSAQKNVRLFQYWQILYCIHSNPGRKASEYAELLGVDVYKIYRIVELYNEKGATFDQQLVWGGRREARSKLSLQQEASLLKGLSPKGTRGQIITVNDIRHKVESLAGGTVSDDYLWDLLNRHGWRKKAPRPQHPKKDAGAQESFKKNSRSWWSPPDKD